MTEKKLHEYKKRIKRYIRMIAIVLAMSLVMPLAGCDASNTSNTSSSESKDSAQKTENVSQDTESSETTEQEETEAEAVSSEENNMIAKDETSESVIDESEIIKTVAEPVKELGLNDIQKNSIAWLNYLACLSQEINLSKYSRMYLEEAYASLIRNTNPENVNELTESHLASMLDSIEKYRMLTVKRDRLKYIYEQNKAKALKQAVPNPVGLLSAVSSFDVKRLAASTIYMAVDSYANYKSYNTEIAQEYLQDGWELDDEEAENMHESRKRAFMFMIDIVRQDQLPGELALNEKSVEDYVTAKNNENNHQKIQFLESEEATYTAFGDYWLTLASCYYENEDYDKCLVAFGKYQEIEAGIFRKDYEMAKTLPKVIVSAREVMPEADYIKTVDGYLTLLKNNTENSDWSLKYFAAEMYLDLYARTNDSEYLNAAYDLALNNVNYLVKEQQKLNTTYREDVKELKTTDLKSDNAKKKTDEDKDDIKAENKRIKKYNEGLKEARKTELPPVYEPLVLNLELLFALAEGRGCSASEKNLIDGIVNGIFYTEHLNAQYSFAYETPVIEATYDKDTLSMPVICLSENVVVKVTIKANSKTVIYDDWIIKEVKRLKDSHDPSEFTATYTSKKARKQEWSADATITISIYYDGEASGTPYELRFKVSEYKARKLLPDTVKFEQVK